MELHEVMSRAQKELESAKRNLSIAQARNAPEPDIRNLEKKIEYRQEIVTMLAGINGSEESA